MSIFLFHLYIVNDLDMSDGFLKTYTSFMWNETDCGKGEVQYNVCP